MHEKQGAKKHHELKEMLSNSRDLILAVRDSMPIFSENERSTPNQRRALRQAILKLLKVWQELYRESNVKEPERSRRINVIEQMRIDALAIVLTHPDISACKPMQAGDICTDCEKIGLPGALCPFHASLDAEI